IVGAQLQTLTHDGPVLDAAFTLNGTGVVTASNDGTAVLWDVASGQRRVTYRSDGQPVRSVALTPDGKRVITISGETVPVDGLLDADPIAPYPVGERVRSLAISHRGDRIATGGLKGDLVVWDAATGAPVFKVSTGEEIWQIVFSPDDTLLAVVHVGISLLS